MDRTMISKLAIVAGGIFLAAFSSIAQSQPAWTVDMRPAVHIGATSGAQEYLLSQVRGVLRTRDARIVAGEFAVRILFYDSAGRHDTTIVRLGQGPGEAELLRGLLPYRGDSIAMLTEAVGTAVARNETVLILDSRGKYARTVVVRTPGASHAGNVRASSSTNTGIQAITSDGSFILMGTAKTELQNREGQRWALAPYFRVTADGSRVDTIAVLPVSDVDEAPSEQAGYKLPFFRREAARVAVFGNFMYWGNGDRFEISVFDITRGSGNATPVRVIRHNIANRAVTAADRRRLETLSLKQSRTAADSASTRSRNATHPSRSTVPAFEAIVADSEGNIWVKHYQLSSRYRVRDDPAEPNVWSVFNPSGAFVSDVTLPPDLAVTQIGSEWILGIWTDSDDVQHLRVHRILKRR